jgi:ribosomal protein L17
MRSVVVTGKGHKFSKPKATARQRHSLAAPLTTKLIHKSKIQNSKIRSSTVQRRENQTNTNNKLGKPTKRLNQLKQIREQTTTKGCTDT